MKKIIKCSFAIIFVLFFGIFFKKVCASDWDDLYFGTLETKDSTVRTVVLKGDISKQQVVNIMEYSYPDSLSASNYKYILWKSKITYFNNVTEQVVASADIECSFKYNTKNKTCECLSSNCSRICENDSCTLDVISRRKNDRLDVGGSFIDIKFKIKGPGDEESTYCVKCDYLGNISVDD